MNNQGYSRGRNRSGQNQHGTSPSSDTSSITSSIKLTPGSLPTNLFSEIAEKAAKHVASEQNGQHASKPTQLRKFYDEICMWNDKSQRDPGRFTEYLPFILMLKAKVAYSKGRKHVNQSYVEILNHCLAEIENNQTRGSETLHNLKLFMEAFTGFYKVYGPSN